VLRRCNWVGLAVAVGLRCLCCLRASACQQAVTTPCGACWQHVLFGPMATASVLVDNHRLHTCAPKQLQVQHL
jgi:hypothetical protein